MYYKRMVEHIINDLSDQKKRLENELPDLPEGELHVSTVNGNSFYYQYVSKSGNMKKASKQGISRDRDLIMNLVRKKYVEKALKNLDSDIDAADAFLKHYKEFDENSVMSDYIEKNPQLAEGIYYGKLTDAEWAENYARSETYKENLKNVSAQGEDMRSMGEIFIASRLEFYNIPFRYEQPLTIPDISNYVPDFTIRRPHDKKIIYWEHLGMVNDREYLDHNSQKLRRYGEYGIVPWDNLIITYNNKDGSINGKLIDAMIQGWLLI